MSTTTPTFPTIPGWVKYVVLSVLLALLTLLEYLQSVNWQITESTLGVGGIMIIVLVIHDIEGYTPGGLPPTSLGQQRLRRQVSKQLLTHR